jgi:AcrR family transcriptional regulator
MPSMTEPTVTRSRRAGAADRRREREAQIIAATRALFDARGVRDAQIEDVARAVGINRAIIYRHFTGKEELFALTEAEYLKDLDARLSAVDDPSASPDERLRRITEGFVDFALAYPAFIDCAVTILRVGPALLDEVSASALFRLGRGMTACLRHVIDVLEAGRSAGVFDVKDPDVVANLMYAQALGGLQVARLGVMVRESTPGVPEVASLDAAEVKRQLVATALALVRQP